MSGFALTVPVPVTVIPLGVPPSLAL